MTREAPVRVGFVIDFLFHGAGTENQLILLLRSFDRSRVSPFLAVLQEGYSRDANAESSGQGDVECPIETLRVRRLWTPRGWAGLTRARTWAQRAHLDLVVTFFRDANIVGTVGARMAGVPVVSSRRNLGKGYWHNRTELLLLRALNSFTARYVSNSEAVRDYTIRAEKVDPSRIEVIPNAIDLQRFREIDQPVEALRSRCGLPAGIVICCVANLRPIKNVAMLVRAYLDSGELRRTASLVLVGTGPEEPPLRDMCRAAGAEDRVHFLGRRNDVPEILAASDIAVLTSRGESSPNAVVEYMASGLPTVATRVGGIPELLGEEEAGILVPSEDVEALRATLESLARDPERRARLGSAARRRVESRHGLDAVIERWTRLFETMVASRPER